MATHRKSFMVKIKSVRPGKRGRKINKSNVKQLAKSMQDLGQQNPIQVQRVAFGYELIAGQHRLEAARINGWEKILAVLMPREEARAWRASENLHRIELDKLSQSLAIIEYGTQRKKFLGVKNDRVPGGMQPNDKGHSKLAAATGFSRKRIAEANAHASLPDSVKAAVFNDSQFNKRTILNRLAALKTEGEQLRFIRERSNSMS
jgi:ParB family transcriptional regulator, chromosome partitioning protein